MSPSSSPPPYRSDVEPVTVTAAALPIPLKTRADRAKLLGQHIDTVLYAATQAGYGVTVMYTGDGKPLSAVANTITVRLDKQNIVVGVR